MILAVADTHSVIWYLANDSRLGTKAKATFTEASRKGDEIAISAITLVEIVYLVERNRIPAGYFSQLLNDLDSNDSILVEVALSPSIVRTLTKVDWSQVPDMPDRIITATALHLNVPVISRDRKIQASNVQTIW
ncbi:MAG: type II toxin-antitoxin system VapC family toxin [Chloroflexota bacterium]